MARKSLKQVLADKIKSERLKTGLSQERFAEVIKVQRNYTGMIERCEANVTLTTLEKIAKNLDTSVSVLLGGNVIFDKKVDMRRLLAQNVKKYRLEKNLTQDDAVKYGLHRTYISKIESGSLNTSIDSIEKMAKFLKVKPYSLFE